MTITLEDVEKLAKILTPAVTDAVNKRFDKLDDKLDKRFTQIDEKFEHIGEKFVQIDERFKQIDKRFKQIDERFEQIDKRFDDVDKRFDEMESKFDDKLEEALSPIHINQKHLLEQAMKTDKNIKILLETREEVQVIKDHLKLDEVK